jgi:hypothetical protein
VRLYFNKALDISAFEAALTINPYCATRVTYDADLTGVTIAAREGWGVNKTYTFTLRDMTAADGYTLSTPFIRTFVTPFATDLPRVTAFCPVALPGTFLLLGANATGAALDNKLLNTQGVGIVFSKAMDGDSVLRALTIEGAKGYLKGIDDRRFVYVSSAAWEIGKRYQLRVSAGAKDTQGLALFDEVTAFFTPDADFLTVTAVTFGDTVRVTDFTDADSITAVALTLVNPANGENQLEVTVNFSAAIDTGERQKAVDCMDLLPLFPATASRPVCISALWGLSGSELRLTWEGITKSEVGVDYYYELSFIGGSGGLSTGRGEHLEANLCVVIHTL